MKKNCPYEHKNLIVKITHVKQRYLKNRFFFWIEHWRKQTFVMGEEYLTLEKCNKTKALYPLVPLKQRYTRNIGTIYPILLIILLDQQFEQFSNLLNHSKVYKSVVFKGEGVTLFCLKQNGPS